MGLPDGNGGNIFETKITESSKNIYVRGEKAKAHNGVPGKVKLQVKFGYIEPDIAGTELRKRVWILQQAKQIFQRHLYTYLLKEVRVKRVEDILQNDRSQTIPGN